MANSSLEAFIGDESQLASVFEEGGGAGARDREQKKNAHKKEQFLNSIIRIRLLDAEGYLHEGCEWTMSRRRVTFDKLMTLIKRSPLPYTEIDYFYDETGVPLWMDDMLLKANPIPSYYTIVPQVRRVPVDIRQDPKYEGQATFLIAQVPLKAKDEITMVDVKTMKEWMLCAIIEEDPHSIPLAAKLQPVRDIIKEIDRKIKGISKMQFFDEGGKKFSDEKAELEREVVYEAFGADRLLAEKRLKKFENNLEAYIVWRKTIGMTFTMDEVDENTGTAVWYVRFHGMKDAAEMEDLLIKKDNWSGIKVACGLPGPPAIPPWAGRGPIPDGSNPLLPDYSQLQVNVAGARFKRVPHGVGAYKRLDRQSASIQSDRFGMYYGNFELGKRVGNAIEIDDVSVFSGRYTNGFKKGRGRIDYGCGTTIIGDFGYSLQIPNKISLLFDNPYVGGEPEGKVEVLFGDGSIYRGEMKNGRIHGHGEYQSAFAGIMVGDFVHGIIHGKGGYRKNHSGEEFLGDWQMGELHGYAKYKNARGDSYEGFFDQGLRHGRGVATYAKLGRYRGYFINGARNGKGELEYGLRPKPKKKKRQQDEQEREEQKGGENVQQVNNKEGVVLSEFLHLYQGYFLSNNVTNGGITMPVDTQIPSVVSRRDKRRLMPISYVLERDAANCKKLQRQVEKYNDMEQFIRGEITFKKLKVFRQQKHFTKKSMYATDQWGGFPKSDLEARTVVRELRLNRMDESVLRPKSTLVPHLQLLSVAPAKHLQPTFENIIPDKSFGPTDQVKILAIKAAVSDFEEVIERQRFLKYDAIFKRAEDAFRSKKRAEKGGGVP